MRRQYTDAERSQLVELVASTGTTIAAAADRLGVHRATACNWVRRAARQAAAARPVPTRPHVAAPRFAQLVSVSASEAGPTLEVSVGVASIRVKAGFDAGLLRAVVEALRGGAA